jgi:hypothetical protein
MDLRQLQLTYHWEQDRILFRTSFTGEDGSIQEIRTWLTRRVVKQLWPGIVKALQTKVALEQPQAAHASGEIVGMAHQASVSETAARGNFASAFENGATVYPMGKQPLLVTDTQCTANAGQPLHIRFKAPRGATLELAFSSSVLHAFCKLLQDAARVAAWDIALSLPGTMVPHDSSRTLN